MKKARSIQKYLPHLANSIWRATKDSFPLYFEYRCAGLSFYTIISLIPLIIVIATILSLLPFETKQIVQSLYRVVPDFPFDIEIILSKASKLLSKERNLYGIISFFFAYFFASRLFLALHRTMRVIFEMKGVVGRHINIQVLGIPIFILGLFVIYFGGLIVVKVMETVFHIKIITKVLPQILMTQIIDITNIVTYFTFSLLIFLMYHFLAPRANRRFRNSLTVTLVIGAIFTLLKNMFGFFINFMASHNPIYAAFGGIFGFLFWIFLSYYVILIGARAIFYLEK